jgi:beta-galactosidase
VAVVYDWETRWAVDNIQGLGRDLKKYAETAIAHYRPFWATGIPVDVIDQTVALDGYRLVITPMLYLLRPGMAQKLSAFVAAGGTWVATYWTGIVDENDLCFTGGWPGAGLREVLGVWDEEIDAGYPLDRNHVVMKAGNALGMKGRFEASELFGLIHAEKARVLATYADDFYKGRPAVTVNSFQKGEAYYLAARTEAAFQDAFYGALIDRMKLKPVLAARLPPGVSAQIRSDGKQDYVFVMNFNDKPVTLTLKAKPARRDLLSGKVVKGSLALPPYGVKVLESLASPRDA